MVDPCLDLMEMHKASLQTTLLSAAEYFRRKNNENNREEREKRLKDVFLFYFYHRAKIYFCSFLCKNIEGSSIDDFFKS